MIRRVFITTTAILFFISFTPLQASVFYVDPLAGDINNPGTSLEPWSTLEEVFNQGLIETQKYSPVPYSSSSVLVPKNAGAPVKAGDTLMLKDGYHGNIFYRGAYNASPITIMNQDGHSPEVASLQLSACSHWIVDGLLISPESAPVFEAKGRLVFIESHGYHGPSHHVTIKNCIVRSVLDATGWDIDDWNDFPGNGIHMAGNHMIIENNLCLNVDDGINISGDTGIMQNNQIINFAGDGMRLQGSDLTAAYNVVKNCYDVNDNHDDGLQSFTNTNNPFERNVIRGNTIINYEDPNQPFRGALQGIGCFDGPYVDWIVENNLVVVNHWHGITLSGAFNCKVVNNTVIDRVLAESPGPPWIRIGNHKDGTPSENCHIRNNIATSIQGDASFVSHNLLVASYDTVFQDFDGLNFQLVQGSAAIDAADPSFAPAIDIEMGTRPIGQGPDMGAYESPFGVSAHSYEVGTDYIKIYHNPTQNSISIGGDSSGKTMGIYNELEELILDLSGQSTPLSVDLNTLTGGNKYFLKINDQFHRELSIQDMIKE